ncbi:MAG: type II/IV secretion system protein, partial [Candidatus Omnitrophica bacterium]|nr:type II/IV secretion system protein [Candidatus Omnitrophota bacterium]
AKVRWDLANLGLLKDDVSKFDALLRNTSGILLVTGPTGSGKTTTLYSCIDKINTKDRKILSIEDPIEYEIGGITQIQVNPDVGLTFARGLRSMLRQDPDVMMVGEIRDKETAEIAIRVALTGHLVLSTLHTNDAASGVTRLVDIGIPPYLLESTVKAFIAQRLVRVICDGCREEDRDDQLSVKEKIVRSMGSGSAGAIKIYKGRGCEKCSFTGFHGRTAIFEILVLTDEIRRMISLGSPASEINKVAVERNGMRTLIQDGWIKVTGGITTPDEILNVCQ